MTGRERLQAIVDGKPTDRLSWSTIVDDHTLGALPDPLKGMGYVDFYRYVDADVVELSGWGTQWPLEGVRMVTPGLVSRQYRDDSGDLVTETRCRRGALRGRVAANNHPVEYPIKTLEDLRIFAGRLEDSHHEPANDGGNFDAIENEIGDTGITTMYMCPSAIPDLLENLIGIEGFYYLMMDYPDEMDALIRQMQEMELSRFDIASHHPCKVYILCENTSTRYISPAIYEKYNLSSQRAFVDAMHREGKTAILHMCGHVNDLLHMIKETGTDGIHALTPPPLGDAPWERALDIIGDHLIIMGCLTPDVWIQCPVSEMAAGLDRMITPRLRESRFVLMGAADGIAVPIERFLAVRDWVHSSCAH